MSRNIIRLEDDINENLASWKEEKIITGLDENDKPVYEKSLYITGIFAQSEVKNGNGRIYPRHVLEKAVRLIQPSIMAGSSWGEMGHPYDGVSRYERACILTTELKMKGNDAIGKARVMNRPEIPLGQLLYGLIQEGIEIGVSTRGRGSVDRNNVVEDGFYFVKPIDVVENPSAPDAIVTAIEEKKDWLVNESIMNEQQYYALKNNIIQSKNSKNYDKNKVKILSDFINSL